MMRSPPDPKRENPEQVELDGVSDGIDALPGRLERYGKAKNGALDVADYMSGIPKHQVMGDKVKNCGSYLVFRHYFTVDQLKLHAAYLCRKHLLCPLCAIRRGSKFLTAYLQRWEIIQAANPKLKPYLVTFTVKDGPDLAERFKHLHKSQRELWMQKHRGRAQSPLAGVLGAVWSYEIKRGKNSGEWHPHIHAVMLAESMPSEGAGNPGPMSAAWHSITGDSFMVDVRPINLADPASGFVEVFKYAVKFSDQPPEDTVHAWVTLSSKRLLASSGCFRGVDVSENLLDDCEALEGLPFYDLFFQHLNGRYSLYRRQSGISEGTRKKERKPSVNVPETVTALGETIRRKTAELHQAREGEKARIAARMASL